MANLAIRGHATRGKEVIEILEMLGGKNKVGLFAKNETLVYFIKNGVINNTCMNPQTLPFKTFTLEEFLEEFPYKVGDKVQFKWATSCGSVYEVEKMRWVDNEIEYTIKRLWHWNDHYTVTVQDLQIYKEETMEENLTIQDIRDNNAEWLLNKLEEMSAESAWQTINDLYDELHKPQYPKTYEECCKVLGIDSDNFLSIRNLYRDDGDEESTDYESDLLDKFEYLWELTICRDAYWKIIGEQMGLDKPWAPVYTDDNIKYSITTHKNRLDFNGTIERNYVLIFPTKEIRNAFYENFKELIEQCKELL